MDQSSEAFSRILENTEYSKPVHLIILKPNQIFFGISNSTSYMIETNQKQKNMKECIFCVLWVNFNKNYQNSQILRPLLSHYRQVKHIICKSQPIVKRDLPKGSKKS